jgi:dephospho-CoA kinase
VDAPRTRPLRIGLTGGIASGKSLVADYFAELGVAVVDTDVIARQVVLPESPALQEICESFGKEVISPDGTLDRGAMRGIVFSDENRRLQLEAILHPRIRRETEQQVAAIADHYLIVVVPLLAESPMQAMMDRILVVDCAEDTQIGRLMARDVETEQQARRIMATQASRKDRLAIADDVISNDGEIEDTQQQILMLHHSYLDMPQVEEF